MYKRAADMASNFAALLLMLLMLLTFIDVCGRNLVNRPVSGASELTEILLAGVIFLMLPRVALRRQHIVIDLIDQFVTRRAHATLNVFAALLSTVLFSIVGWQMWIQGNKALGYADSTPVLNVPIAPVLYGIAVLAGFSAAAFLLAILEPRRKTPA